MTHKAGEVWYNGKGVEGVHYISLGPDALQFCAVLPGTKNSAAKIKRIVTAVNAHDRLLEALERLAKRTLEFVGVGEIAELLDCDIEMQKLSLEGLAAVKAARP